MSMTPADIIKEEKTKLITAVYAALSEFTEKTGYPVDRMKWECAQACGSDGKVMASSYYDFRVFAMITED